MLDTITVHRQPVILLKVPHEPPRLHAAPSSCTANFRAIAIARSSSQYNDKFDTVVSIDSKGMIEYWIPPVETGSVVLQETLKEMHNKIEFSFKSETDLYEFAKKKTLPLSLTFSHDGRLFATYGVDRQVPCRASVAHTRSRALLRELIVASCGAGDIQVRVFRFLTGKLWRQYDESLQTYFDIQKDESSPYHLDDIDFGKRMAVERELDKVWASAAAPPAAAAASSTSSSSSSSSSDSAPGPVARKVITSLPNVDFDESSNFIMFTTMLGIKSTSLQPVATSGF